MTLSCDLNKYNGLFLLLNYDIGSALTYVKWRKETWKKHQMRKLAWKKNNESFSNLILTTSPIGSRRTVMIGSLLESIGWKRINLISLAYFNCKCHTQQTCTFTKQYHVNSFLLPTYLPTYFHYPDKLYYKTERYSNSN
jgi:hypothetical protein